MTEKRIQFNNIIQNQLPQYVREEFPLVAEFLKQYYISQEFQSASTDLIQNIDQYLKLSNIKTNSEETTLTSDVTFLDETIQVSNTTGFPDSYGLIQIDNEIITYTGKTATSFTGCVRGFSGVTSYNNQNNPDQLTFSSSQSADHSKQNIDGSTKSVINLSSFFLKEFFNKIKYQLTPGFEQREFYSNLDKYLFLKQSKDFYSTRGTDLSFKILFKVLYGEEVKIIKPQDYLTKPSDSQYEITNDLVVEAISGDPYDLERSTLYQDEYGDITKAYAPISKVEKIFSKDDKTYYKLSFDAGYNRDITVEGSLYGNFSVHPKTRLIGEVNIGEDTLDVDSTVGFPSSGELSILYNDGTQGTISYSSKSITQFFGCQNILKPILDGTDVWLNVYAKNKDETIKVRITSVLKEVDLIDQTYYYSKNDTGIIKTLGVNPEDKITSDNWIFNISPTIEVSSITLRSNTTYRLVTKIDHNLKVGDNLKVSASNGSFSYCRVSSIGSSNLLEISGQGFLDLNLSYTIQRTLHKVNSQKYSYLSNQTTDIQNIYKIKDKTLVASSSLPFYGETLLNAFDRSISFKGLFVGPELLPEYPGFTDTLNLNFDHGFYTGDSVYYTPSSKDDSLFDEGVYFIQRVNSTTVRFAKSRANIYRSIFVRFESSVQLINDSKLQDYEFYSKKLTSQKLFREISPPINDGNDYETSPGPTGILINGVEILNYKSKDNIYYGPIDNIDIINSGSGYDVINPPTLIISDAVGTGATGYCSVNGNLQEIRIIDPGFDYLETPKIDITGGNGTGAKASASMKLIDHQVSFNAESRSAFVNITNNTIGFSTYHKFRNAEKVVYRTNGQRAVGGITTNSLYYVSTQDLFTVKLHKTFEDALSGVSTIALTSFGVGNHIIESYNKKSIISAINIEDSGVNYQNKRRTTTSAGIITSLGQITIKNHDYQSGEIVNYTTSGSPITGLSTNTNYYVTKVDEDNFKLSLVGVGTDNQDFYYRTNQYIQFTSSGSGVHTFNYPQISVKVIGSVGLSSSFEAVVQPIFRGEIKSIHLENTGVGYGSSEIINFDRSPDAILTSGTEASLIPIINNGKIDQVLINNPGKDYNSPPNLDIVTNGAGVGAVLTPILENGQIRSVKIIESGGGYDPNNTFIVVSSAGSGAEIKPKIKVWNINLLTRYFSKITPDDGFISYNPNSKYGLQYSHIYAPRKLRENISPKDISGKILYGKYDLLRSGRNGIEISSTDHSSIIGWAYDGNPIYGPYGFSNKNGGSIVRMKSGYVENLLPNRPPFPIGFFVDDYKHYEVSDDSVLDEYNGRFCVTPDFPNGTYAYFATISDEVSNSFGNYKLPVFPYIIGNKFKSTPNSFNFDRKSNQDYINLNETDWARNTTPYNILKNGGSYSYISLPNELNQTVDIKYASPGSIESVGIVTGGSDYKVNDKVIFDEEGTSGFGFVSKVSRVGGKNVTSISVASTVFYDSEIYSLEGNKNLLTVQLNSPPNFLNADIVSVSGVNTTSSLLEGSYTIGVSTNTLAVSSPSGIGSVAVTGIVTFISVSGNLSAVRENDVYIIGTEKVKVLNVDKNSSRIRVLRAIDGTVGIAHSYTDILYETARRFTINAKDASAYNFKVNKEIYFNPKESLGLGAISGVGIGTTISFSNPGAGITQIFIPTKSIYIPNHNLETGDSLTYSSNSGTTILVSKDGVTPSTLANQSTVYVAKITNDLIGISTVRVGLGTTGTFVGIGSTALISSTLYFTGIGTGTYHSFKTNYPKLSGEISKNTVTVSTAQTHGLLNNDYVYVNVSPGLSTSVVVKYDDYNRKILVNPRSFVSSDVNVSSNAITITNHKFKNGQKVVYTSSSPSGGLVNNQIYYVVVFDKDTIKLSSSYYSVINLNPEIVNITSASSGILSPINPPIKAYKDSVIVFDLSDSSLSYPTGAIRYSAFELNFYVDSNYTQIFDKSNFSESFDVVRSGEVGIDANARVSLTVTGNIPQKLYYRLDPIYNSTLPSVKEEVSVDSSVVSNNEIQVLLSEYNGKHRITSVSSSSFTYNLDHLPESNSYNSSSKMSYETTSLTALGPVSKIDITSKGQNYASLPKFSSINSRYGVGAIVEVSSRSIGKVQKTKINDIGFDFSCDSTIRPNLSLPQILKIEPLNSLKSVGITSVGRGYTTAPKLAVLDGYTRELLSEVDLRYSLGDNYATILNNTYRLNDVEPIIIPTQNSNGVSVGLVTYSSVTKNVTITLSVGFSTANSFPFSVNDKIFVENVSVGINSTAKGFNSADYNYQLFTITAVDPNIGGFGSIVYNLGEFLSAGETPGTYDSVNSSGRVIAEKNFPKFDVTLSPNNFFENEDVKYPSQNNSIGVIETWNQKTKYAKVSSREILQEGLIIEGISSKTRGRISSVVRFDAFINVGPYSRVENGWVTETGILNNQLQRIQDNFYYQNFSYSLKSRVPYDTWEDAVGSLNHTAGFKKFSDYQLETFGYAGISTDAISAVDVTADLYGVASLNCVYDFDLAKENALITGSSVISDEIVFSSRILTDYDESIGNRVLSIDDISGQFNSSPRPTRFSIAHRFLLSDARAQKYIAYIRDKRYTTDRQVMLFTLLHDDVTGYLNQYGRVETNYDLGSFDFDIDDNEGLILFYPTKFRVNDYDVTTLSYNLKDNFYGIGSTTLGGIITLDTNTTSVSSGATTIVSIGKTYTSTKILVEISGNNGQYQFDELNVIHDGTDVEFVDYGQLTNTYYSSSGLGTYYAYISGSDLKVDFTPIVGLAASVSTIQVSIADTSVSGIGTFDIKYARFGARSTSIASTTSPSENIIAEYPNDYDGGYYLVQVSDITNNRHQLSEIVALDDENNVYITEFGNVETLSGLGTIGAVKTASATRLVFTPLPNIETQVKVYFNSLTNFDEINTLTQYNNYTVVSDYNVYYGTERDVRRSFELKHQGYPIFQKYFDASSSSVVSVASSTITIPNHFFVTGEEITYSPGTPTATSVAIGIASTDFGVGIGITDKLPSTVYAIKVDENKIKLARSAEDALKLVPKALDIISVGIGTSHVFISTKQNVKSIITIDNVIQAPIVATSTTTLLSSNLLSIDDLLFVDSTLNLFSGDLLQINNEIMKIESVGVGGTNAVRVGRPWLGTNLETHSSGSLVTKMMGDYNIVKNNINFIDAPYGNVPLGISISPPDERDWTGITTSSSFHGRVFMRSGIIDSSNESYHKNYIFDDISSLFDGSNKSFSLTSDASNVTDFYTDNAVILINEIFQEPGTLNNYTLSESVGVTSITFVGSATSLATDINTTSLPFGGVIVSVGSTQGLGYQPLVSAGGTAVVSIAGTISSISIGNSGSGYRSSIYTSSGIATVTVRVGVGTSSTGTPNIQFIGTAAISNGSIVSIAITNPGIGYTTSNPPYVIIDPPLSYSDIPLFYSSTSSGVGTEATVDIVVGQGSSVIDFEIKNNGYGYRVGDVLTLPVGGPTGIPTTPNSAVEEFKIIINEVEKDKFSAWSIGELKVYDKIEKLFDGKRVSFPITENQLPIGLYARRGSLINIQDNLLVFINDILQVPGEGYIFKGGSKIQFTEPPNPEDTCKIVFYRGSGIGVDVIPRDIIDTVKVGDDVQLTYDSLIGQSSILLEDERKVVDVVTIDTVDTNPYFGPGNTTNPTLSRPINWCKQTEDLIINDKNVTKDRDLYEPRIYPSTYIIQPVGVGSTIIYVENLRPFFNPLNENNVSISFQNDVTFVPQDDKVPARATASVSVAGTISSFTILDGGAGYSIAPEVTIQNPIGIGITTSTAISSITSGIVTSISIVGVVTGYSPENPPVVLIEPPAVNIEKNKVSLYEGDFGIISGISTTSVGVASTAIVFDFLIPNNSILRGGLIAGITTITGITTISGIQTGFYFVISNSNVGNGVTSLNSLGQVVGSGTRYLDGVYQVASVSIAQTSTVGFGLTYVAKVTVSVSNYNGLSGIGYSDYYGNFSWGRILLKSRSKEQTYNAYTNNGYIGISTGTIIRRTEPLKYSNYL